MPKQNAFLAKMQAKHRIELQQDRLFTIQYCKDAAMMAAAELFGMGEKRASEFSEKYDYFLNEISRLIHDDSKADADITYSRAVVDRRLREICGSNFVEWDERYKFN